MKPALSIKKLLAEAKAFSKAESTHDEPALFGVTDGKAVGTYLEHKVHRALDGQVFIRGRQLGVRH